MTTADATEHLAATNEILNALGRAGGAPDAVLDTIVDHAARLCRAQAAQIYLIDDGVFRLTRVSGAAPADFQDYIAQHPVALSRASLLGRVALDRRAQQIADVLTDPGYGRQDLQRLGGYRTLMSAPMLVDDDVVGVLGVWRTAVEPFDDRAMELLGVFAAQAALAIRNVSLLRDLQARRSELARKVDQLEVLSEVGQAVSSSLDLDEVLHTIVTNAVRLTGTDGGSIMEYVDEQECFSVRAAHGSSDELAQRLRQIPIERSSTLVGRAAAEGLPLEVPDLEDAALDPHLQALYDDGWRSVLAVPMLRQGRTIGALVVRRRSTGGFGDETRELLQTLASQSGLAILNARLFRELATKTAELEVASRHKSEFLASMSHELRTPLNAVIGFSEVLLDRMFGDINERQEEYLHDIRGSGRHLLELLNEILDLSKVEAGHMQLEYSVFPVKAALEYALSLVRERAAAHAIALFLEVDDSVADVEADELRFRQVLLNLLSNAVKFTQDGGHVSVTARRDGPSLTVEVTDDGIGVPVGEQQRIFEAFQQGGRNARKEEGTGLGLTLSKRIVDLLGGRMWLQSEVGRGSTFGFAIPLTRAERQSAASVVPGDGAAASEPKVVLIDRDRASLDLFAAYLEGLRVVPVAALNAHSGIETVRRHQPAAVVLDIRLPDMQGWDVLATLKSDAATAGIPVVVASVLDERRRGLAAGADEYLTKPVTRERFLEALTRVGALPAPTAVSQEIR